ncbi:dihydrodipicolinate synthase family protein [Agarilytica rhodophyticola]|uniref:dihydrodipicolinate synthase family protein n=1 Tax=Agarilytica rhodophyticola TaxID=1737490 RepID=UPI000B34534C|nr:dihydrodipicolinate synthase family protein [Agarilytica rhodophyticola]
MKVDWRGYFAAAVTPFDANHELNEDALHQYMLWLVKEKMHGIVLAGSNGEWPALTKEERIRLFKIGRDSVPKTTPLIGGCGAISVRETEYYLEQCAELEMDGALVSIPPYVSPTDREVLNFFTQISAKAQLPIIAYNWPIGTAKDLSPELLNNIADLENIVAIKNSTPDLSAFISCLRMIRNKVQAFGIMPGDVGMGLLDAVGGDGCIGAAGTLGHIQPDFFDAFWSGNKQEAKKLGAIDQDLMTSMFQGFTGRNGHAIAIFKAILRERGVPVGPVRPPLLDLDEPALKNIRQFLEKHGL